jgi:glycosyltransferase involved in cell wall biosynthesis
MRVLHLSNHCIFGNGNVHAAVDLACAQSAAGHKVFYGSEGGDFVSLLAANRVEHLSLPQNHKKPLRVLASLVRLIGLIKREKIDIIHAHMMTGAILGRLAGSVCGVPLVTTVHNAFDRHAVIMGLGDRVIAVSEAVATNMISRGVKAKKVISILNGTLNAARRKDEPETTADLEHLAITTICGLHDRKGLPSLIEAFDIVSKSEPKAHLYIIGEGPDEARYWRQASQLECADRVHFLGQQRATKPFLRATDIFVLASLQDPCPLVIPEAREMGCAIVATHVDGIPEMLAVGPCGVMVPANDPIALASAIGELLADPIKREREKQAALVGIAYFDIDRVREDADRVYLSALADRHKPKKPRQTGRALSV